MYPQHAAGSQTLALSRTTVFFITIIIIVIRRGATTVTFGWPDIKRAAERVYW